MKYGPQALLAFGFLVVVGSESAQLVGGFDCADDLLLVGRVVFFQLRDESFHIFDLRPVLERERVFHFVDLLDFLVFHLNVVLIQDNCCEIFTAATVFCFE